VWSIEGRMPKRRGKGSVKGPVKYRCPNMPGIRFKNVNGEGPPIWVMRNSDSDPDSEDENAEDQIADTEDQNADTNPHLNMGGNDEEEENCDGDNDNVASSPPPPRG
jgi:hypothetical protein